MCGVVQAPSTSVATAHGSECRSTGSEKDGSPRRFKGTQTPWSFHWIL